MPGLDLSQLSSNWKRLQGRLQAETISENKSNGLKRKRVVKDRSEPVVKKQKTSLKPQRVSRVIRPKMDSAPSRNESPLHKQGLTSPQGDEPNVSMTSPTNILNGHTDTINTGLHPTQKPGKYLALDTEMVGTGPPPYSDNVLARVSIVNFHGDQVYDAYVRPPPGITVKDYRTFVSGIRPEHLHPSSARSFDSIREDVATLLSGRVLVGHALRNDFQVLQLNHPKADVRDTSHYTKWRKAAHGAPALRNLAKSELGIEIQSGEHSSLEDARATMLLFRWEKQGIEEEVRRRFGTGRAGGRKERMERLVEGEAARGAGERKGSVDDSGDESDESDPLDGEEDADEDKEGESSNVGKVLPLAKKKKSKKKKRTRRK